MFATSPLQASRAESNSDPDPVHPRAALAREVLLRRKRSAVQLALTGQLLADTRELLDRLSVATPPSGSASRRGFTPATA